MSCFGGMFGPLPDNPRETRTMSVASICDNTPSSTNCAISAGVEIGTRHNSYVVILLLL